MVDFSGLHNRFGKAYKQKAVELQTKMLLDYAPRKLKEAYEGRTFQNRTFNLADSYVWVVYYNGVIEGSGFLWNGSVAQGKSKFHGQEIDGREMARLFTEQYSPRATSGWELVFAATAPYSSYLEGEEFYVISEIFDSVTIDFRGKARVEFIQNR